VSLCPIVDTCQRPQGAAVSVVVVADWDEDDGATATSSVSQTLLISQLLLEKKRSQQASALGWIMLGSFFILLGYTNELLHQYPDVLVKSMCHSLLTQANPLFNDCIDSLENSLFNSLAVFMPRS
jgi:hypothetical protein